MTITGVDVSEAQGQIDWSRVKAGGIGFAFIKAWENRTDHDWTVNWDGAKAAGIQRGAYCFARPGSYSAPAQAQAFLAAVGADQGELPLVLDLEDAGGLNPGLLVGWAHAFLDTLRQQSGRTPILYTYSGFLSSALGSDPSLEAWPLWIANYQAKAPATPWAWLYWQNTSSGTVPGITGRVDLDVAAASVLATIGPPEPTGDAVIQILVPDNAQVVTSGPWAGRTPYYELDTVKRTLRGFNGADIKGSTVGLGVASVDLPAAAVGDVKGFGQAAKRDGLVVAVGADGGTFDYAYPDGAPYAGAGPVPGADVSNKGPGL